MGSKSFDEASEQVRRLMEVAGGSCDAYATPDPAPSCPLPKKNYRVWEEEVSSPLLDTPPEPTATRAAPDWLQGGGYVGAEDKGTEPSRDELDEFIREGFGSAGPDLDPNVHPCCGCSCSVCERGHSKGQHAKECVARFESEAFAPASTSTPTPSDPEEVSEIECGGMVQVYRGETAHAPISSEYTLIGSVDDAGELLAIYTAFQETLLHGVEESQVKMDSGTYTLYNKPGRAELIDDVKGIRYIKADFAEMNHYAPLVEDRDLFIWVIPTPEHQQGPSDDLGYIHDGWAYGRLGRE